MAITVKEKEHWRERITKKIERRIDKLVATQRPSYLGEVDRKSREEASGILNLSKTLDRQNLIRESIAKLKKEESQLQHEAASIVTGKSLEELIKTNEWQLNRIVDEAMKKAQRIAERDVLSRDALGRTIQVFQASTASVFDCWRWARIRAVETCGCRLS